MFDFDDPKNWSALLIGILLMALGAIPLLNKFGIISWGGFLAANWFISLIPYILAAGGVYLLIDAFMEDDTMRIMSILIAIAIIAIGIVQILFSFKIIGFSIPFINDTIYYVLFVVEGLFLFLAAFFMF